MKKGWKRRSKCGRKEDGQEMENEVTLFGDSTIQFDVKYVWKMGTPHGQ